MRNCLISIALVLGSLPGIFGAETRSSAGDPFDALMMEARAAYEAHDLDKASELYQRGCPAEVLASDTLFRFAFCQHQLASIDSAKGDEASAEQHYLKAVDSWKKTGAPFAAYWCVSLMSLGDLYRREHRLPEAERALQGAVAIARDLPPATAQLYPATLSRLGITWQERTRYDEALGALKESLRLFEKLPEPSKAEEAFAWNGLGMVQLGGGSQKEAQASLRLAVAKATEALGEDHPETAIYQTNLALSLIAEGEFDRAGALLRRARVVIEKYKGPNDPGMGLILAELSAAASGANKLSIAEEYAQQAIAVLSRQRNTDGAAVALAQVNLADVYLRAHKTEEAEKLLVPAVAAERQLVPDTRLLADALRRMGDLRAMQHSWQAAESLYREAIAIYEKRLGASNPALAPALRGYAEVLRRNGGSKAEVKVLEARAKSVSAFLPGS